MLFLDRLCLFAVARLDTDCLELLLAYGADGGLPDGQDQLPLIMLSQLRNLDDKSSRQRVDRMRILNQFGRLEYGPEFVDQRLAPPGIETALMAACFWNQPDSVTILLAEGPEVNIRNRFGETALSICIRQRSHDSLQVILNHEKNSFENLTGYNCCNWLKDAQGWADAEALRILIWSRIRVGSWIPNATEWCSLERSYDLRVMKFLKGYHCGKNSSGP